MKYSINRVGHSFLSNNRCVQRLVGHSPVWKNTALRRSRSEPVVALQAHQRYCYCYSYPAWWERDASPNLLVMSWPTDSKTAGCDRDMIGDQTQPLIGGVAGPLSSSLR